jgi:DNA-binding beta-propeller fold protein YncE
VSAPAPSNPATRRSSRGTIVLVAAVLLLPLGFIFLVSRRGDRPIAPAAPSSPASAVEAESGDPKILESPDPSVPAFGKLKEPRDAAVDSRGRLWVADFGNSRLRIYDSAGGYLGGWGGKGDGPHAFRDLTAVATAGESIYVADTWNGRVEKFGLDGSRQAVAPGLFGPRGLAAGRDGEVWVSDTGNHRVIHYDPTLKPIDTLGHQGSGPGEFSSPVGVAIAPAGTVYVADTGNRRIVLLDSTGKFQSSWTVPGWERPVEPHLEPDGDGGLWATDPGSAQAVLHFDRTGSVTERRTGDDHGVRFSLPTGLALDPKSHVLYVVNSGNNTISKISTGAAAGAP